MHDGHRSRLRNRFMKSGISSFEEHQALELLLFYAIPRKDTNELAHLLLNEFGSLKNLFSADVADIVKIPGIGESAAILIKLIPELSTKYWFFTPTEQVELSSIDIAAEYAKSLLYGKTTEHFYLICLNPSYKIIHTECLSKGTPTQTPVSIRRVVEVAIRNNADKLIILHNHPGGKPSPSQKDISVTIQIVNALEALQIVLVDHLIISDNDYYSFASQQLIRKNVLPAEAAAAQYSTTL